MRTRNQIENEIAQIDAEIRRLNASKLALKQEWVSAWKTPVSSGRMEHLPSLMERWNYQESTAKSPQQAKRFLSKFLRAQAIVRELAFRATGYKPEYF
jgi:hypothetical protein